MISKSYFQDILVVILTIFGALFLGFVYNGIVNGLYPHYLTVAILLTLNAIFFLERFFGRKFTNEILNNSKGWRYFLPIVLITVFTSYGLKYLIHGFRSESLPNYLLYQDTLIPYLLILTIAGPLLEETLFKYFLLNKLSGRNVFFSAGILSITFCAFHPINYQTPSFFIFQFCSIIHFYKYKNLVLCILAHIVINYIYIHINLGEQIALILF